MMADRREFSDAVYAEIVARAAGRCECYRMPADIRHMFPANCDRKPSQVDHIYADVLETDKSTPLTADDGAHLSNACHLIKTAADQKARATRNRHAVRKDRPQSGWFHKGRKLQSKGFDKTRTRRVDGTVVKRKGVVS